MRRFWPLGRDPPTKCQEAAAEENPQWSASTSSCCRTWGGHRVGPAAEGAGGRAREVAEHLEEGGVLSGGQKERARGICDEMKFRVQIPCNLKSQFARTIEKKRKWVVMSKLRV